MIPTWFRMPCLFQMMTGLYCPGCGGTRAVRALLSGHPVLSFLYHPVVPYMASVAVWAAASWILYFATGNRRFRPELDDRIAYAAAGIVILNFIIKNGLLVFAGIDVIGRLPGCENRGEDLERVPKVVSVLGLFCFMPQFCRRYALFCVTSFTV